MDGFEENKSGHRAYRIGIDVSLWLAQTRAIASKYKDNYTDEQLENPELDILFHKMRRLAALPFLALFMFDGRKRPKVKRGK